MCWERIRREKGHEGHVDASLQVLIFTLLPLSVKYKNIFQDVERVIKKHKYNYSVSFLK